MGNAMIPRARLEGRTLDILLASIEEMKAALQAVATDEPGPAPVDLGPIEARIKALEEKPTPEAPPAIEHVIEAPPIVEALHKCEVRIEAIRSRLNRRRKFHFDVHHSGGQIVDVIAREVDAKPGEIRFEDIVDELDDIERALREAPSSVSKAQRARHAQLLRIQESAITDRRK